MSNVFNTSYKVHVEHTNQAEVDSVNIEQGALLHTTDALYMGHNNQNVVVYPQNVTTIGGWARYSDTEYTSSNKFSLSNGVEYVIPNNSGVTVKSHPSINFYNSSTKKVLAVNENDVYLMTVVFKCSVSNAEQGHLDLHFEGGNGTPYDRIRAERNFTKGNNVDHDFHQVFQYYADSSVLTYGLDWKITSTGSDGLIWDIIYFIQRTQNADFA